MARPKKNAAAPVQKKRGRKAKSGSGLGIQTISTYSSSHPVEAAFLENHFKSNKNVSSNGGVFTSSDSAALTKGVEAYKSAKLSVDEFIKLLGSAGISPSSGGASAGPARRGRKPKAAVAAAAGDASPKKRRKRGPNRSAEEKEADAKIKGARLKAKKLLKLPSKGRLKPEDQKALDAKIKELLK